MKRILSVLLALGLLIGCLTACGASSGAVKGDAYASDSYGSGAFPADESVEKSASGAAAPLPADRKIIRDARLTLETKTFDAALDALDRQIEAVGGYVESFETDGSDGSYRDAEIVVRVPADELDDFLAAAEGWGSVTYLSSSARDVTDAYVDTESRLAAIKAEQEALTDLLKNASSLSDVLEVRDRLSEVTAQLESYQARLNLMDSQIAYSTVTLTLREVELIVPAESGFWQEVGVRFVNNLARIGRGLRGFAIWFLGALPWLIFLAAIGLAVFFIIRGSVRRKRRRRRQKAEEKQTRE